jgi:calcium/proton exchanger cax
MDFNKQVTQLMSSLMVVASTYLIVPSVLYSTSGPDTSGSPGGSVQFLSVITSIILLLFYTLFLIFQLYSHRELFQGKKRTTNPINSESHPDSYSFCLRQFVSTFDPIPCSTVSMALWKHCISAELLSV